MFQNPFTYYSNKLNLFVTLDIRIGWINVTQLNIRIDPEMDDIISLLASEKGTSKALVARELLSQGLNQVLFPVLAKLYQERKISLKRIIDLTKMRPVEVLEMLPKYLEKSPITPEIDEYTSHITEKIIARLKKRKSAQFLELSSFCLC